MQIFLCCEEKVMRIEDNENYKKNCKLYLIVMMSKCNKQKVFLYAKYIFERIILIFFWFGGEMWPGHVFVRFTKLNYSCESLCICMSVGVWEEGNENKEYLNSLPSQKKQTQRKKNLYVFLLFNSKLTKLTFAQISVINLKLSKDQFTFQT